ncbi:uncharacterized protein F5147DRAFT_762102 [Suillus discolor]|uniref:MPN domain-containing protein n=1 Tax=Suillus discolor TaxID=1912936 RepID=A0A9P7F2Q4_9AGAM|nr:uncharacterized protein F5147DRAFT_762102 [Suillus discolor]KAG2104350.1 hypothetical protein F5147DRAFT_762102 [Suillus discolor]
MSQHQLKQGYAPSLQSMFNYPILKPTNLVRSSLLFVPESSQLSTNQLPDPSVVVLPSQPASYPYSQNTTRSTSDVYFDSAAPYSSLARAPQAALPPPPAPVRHIDGDRYRTASSESARITCKASDPVQVPDLKTHSTSDTCAMDEEDSSFTEERSLITLGWIHTHPSQSFDLHTHSGFQPMLPESFVVVCAPKFTPNFGIFRLTDPPGLQTTLDCNVKEAFHPHPEVPIYTDADKGHVQMKDVPLEIVDLR